MTECRSGVRFCLAEKLGNLGSVNNCCITPVEKNEAIENLSMIFKASQQAALTAPQHEGIKVAAQKIAAILDKTQSLTANLQESEIIPCPSKPNNTD